jgi:hypothetical protein
VAAAGGVLDVVRLVKGHDIKRDGAQEGAVCTARIGFEVGVRCDHDVPRHHRATCETGFNILKNPYGHDSDGAPLAS